MINPFINKDFALLSIGQFTSMIGDSIHQVAIIWWLYNITGSPGTTGLLTMAAMIPSLILGPYMGVLADKLNRRRIVYGMDFCRAAVIGTITVLAFTGRLQIWHMVLSNILIGIIASLFTPAATAMVPSLVGIDKLQKAQSVIQAMQGMVGIFGPALGGLLVSTFGYATAFLINAIMLFCSGVSEVFITYHHISPGREESNLNALMKAVRFTFGMPTILGVLLIFGIMNFALAPIGSVTVPYIIKTQLGYGATELGLVMTFLSIGSITGSILMGTLKNPKRLSRLMVLAGIGVGIALTSWLLKPTLTWFYTICVISGVMMVIININAGVLLMSVTPDDMRGKMTAFTHFVVSFMSPISLAIFSMIAKADPNLVFYFPAVTGVIIALASMSMMLVKGFRHM